MKWTFGRQLSDVKLIDEFEKRHSIKFEEAYIETVKRDNGGYPERYSFNTSNSRGKTIQCLLSFNKTDDSNIWSANEGIKDVVRFASNDFGGYLVFDRRGSVLFHNHETGELEFVSNCFKNFLKQLY